MLPPPTPSGDGGNPIHPSPSSAPLPPPAIASRPLAAPQSLPSQPVVGEPPSTTRSNPTPKVVIAVLVVAALIGGGLALLLGGGDDTSTESVDTVGTTAASTDGPTTTIAITTTSATVVETTSAPTESEFFGPGGSFVVSDPLPSGLSMDRADDALPFAQLFADRLAEGNWAGINRMLSDTPATDAQLEASFGGVDRLSLIVVDASDDGFAVTLQLIGVANEADATTTIRCFRWSVSPDGLSSGGVYDALIIDQLNDQVTPESVFDDATLMNAYSAECTLT